MFLNMVIIRVVVLLKDHLNLTLKIFVNFKLLITLPYIVLLVGDLTLERIIDQRDQVQYQLRCVKLCIQLVLNTTLINLNKLTVLNNSIIDILFLKI